MKKNKLFFTISTFLIISLVGFGTYFYNKIFSENVLKDSELYILKNDNITDIQNKLNTITKDVSLFELVAKKKNYITPKSGRYLLKKGMSLNDIINLLRSGNQTAIKVSFNNQDSLEKLAGRISQQLEIDSLSLLSEMKDTLFLHKNGFTLENALQMYLPNSYQLYWNTSAKKFKQRMLQEFKRFWTSAKIEKAKKLNLTIDQVITLASIVQKETSKVSERPIVAGLYLNRHQNNWPLQADPTIIYALKKHYGDDFEVKRVLTKDLSIQSPYNTYLHKGLPPALISMPDISSIEAVLNPTKHNYFYMCASVDKIGYHEFATTLSQHNSNAKKYQLWVSKQGIQR